MAKRCEEEFNPWPPFVDIFSSVILVLLLFLLITIVNIAYYAQFKFKVSYTGTIATNELIVKTTTPPVPKIEEEKKEKKIKVEDALEEKEDIGEIQSAGKDFSKIYEDESTKQVTLSADDYLVVNFGTNTIKLDNPIILQVKEFVEKVKKKYPRHTVYISAVDPTNQVSATVMKQISLGRTLNMRNLVRSLKYNIKDVRVDLLRKENIDIKNENDFGYLIIKIEKK